MEELPRDILRKIFSSASFGTQAKLSGVSRRIRSLLRSSSFKPKNPCETWMQVHGPSFQCVFAFDPVLRSWYKLEMVAGDEEKEGPDASEAATVSIALPGCCLKDQDNFLWLRPNRFAVLYSPTSGCLAGLFPAIPNSISYRDKDPGPGVFVAVAASQESEEWMDTSDDKAGRRLSGILAIRNGCDRPSWTAIGDGNTPGGGPVLDDPEVFTSAIGPSAFYFSCFEDAGETIYALDANTLEWSTKQINTDAFSEHVFVSHGPLIASSSSGSLVAATTCEDEFVLEKGKPGPETHVVIYTLDLEKSKWIRLCQMPPDMEKYLSSSHIGIRAGIGVLFFYSLTADSFRSVTYDQESENFEIVPENQELNACIKESSRLSKQRSCLGDKRTREDLAALETASPKTLKTLGGNSFF
ncbi:hypothetical protein SELMODRAFT_407326 [Selaginella moellendorffii]|uniref:F-box domain-containing protein n=1 Tax=Selaginella moellendorffii TaxID=88036 RepID=D8R4N9_SELML|nr:hypothetical protein SELMODRAFT_407326 [Selaginella moellendorffii]